MVKICVVGAGIIGLSSAISIQKKFPNAEIQIVADIFSPDTTGDGAAGIWGPYLLGSTPENDIYKWSKATHKLLENFWKSGEGGKMGISMIPCWRVSSSDDYPEPKWKDIVYGFRHLTVEELRTLRKPSLKKGYGFTTFVCEPVKLLPYFRSQFEQAGGRVVKQRVTNLESLRRDFDIVVNCSGVGAHHLVSDLSVQPKRGQVIRVKAPGMFWAVLDDDDDGNYIIPNQDSTVLGGTHQEGDWNRNVYPEDTAFIKEGCFRIVPSLKNATVLREWVGLRPGRPSIRLEMETLRLPGEKPLIIIHSYGHGGSGVTLFWGCAQDVTELVRDAIVKLVSEKSRL